jgi:hypothetical protein
VIDATLLALLGAIAGTAFLYALTLSIRDGRARAARRAAYLDGVKEVFTGGVKVIAPTGFPRLSGTYRGRTFDIQAVPDTLNVRKLPALWVLVSLVEPMPVRATLDIMMRPRGVEYFSRHAALPVQLEPDPGLPHDSSLRTDLPEALPPRDIVLKHAQILADPLAKELVISPQGLRLVWLAEEAHRGRYLIFRDSEMGLEPFPAAALKPLLDHLLALRDDLAARMPETAP